MGLADILEFCFSYLYHSKFEKNKIDIVATFVTFINLLRCFLDINYAIANESITCNG